MAQHPISVEDAWSAHRRWSLVADQAHAAIDRKRLLNLGLLIAAAVAGALGGLIDHEATQRVCAAIAAGLLGIAALVQQRLGEVDIAAWIETRLASERLKGAVYRALVIDDDASATALEEAVEATASASLHLVRYEEVADDGSAIPEVDGLASYVELRAQDQADWHRGKLVGLQAKGRRLRHIELGLTVLGVVAAAVATATEVSRMAAVVTLLTTAAAVVAAHIGATKHERVAAGYARTTNRIEAAIRRLPADATEVTGGQAGAFVETVESILAQQNESWASISSPS